MTDYAGTIDRVEIPSGRPWGGVATSAEAVDETRRGWIAAYRRTAMWRDALLAVLAGLVGFFARAADQDNLLLYAGVTVLVPVFWLGAMGAAHAYHSKYIGAGTEEYRAILRAGLLVVSAIAVTAYVSRFDLARSYVLLVVPIVLALSLVSRLQQRTRLMRRRKQGLDLSSTIVVGRVDSVRAMIRNIKADPACGLQVVGACVSGLDNPWDKRDELDGVPVLGSPERALWAVDAVKADAVAISSHPDLVGNALRRLGWALEDRQVDLLVEPGIVGVAGPRLSLRPASHLSMLHVERPATNGFPAKAKQLVDRVAALVILIVLAPVFAVVALAIKLDSRGPVFFRQVRIGAKSEPFKMVKFRSMVTNAEAIKHTLRSDQQGNTLFKMRKDPRVTRVGTFIRKYSIDELPQLINVVKGDMSLIGPRPNLPSEVETYEWDATRRLHVRPGMTGLWQVSGRSDLSWEDSLRLDLWYVDNWSVALDLVILTRTFRAVLCGGGAY